MVERRGIEVGNIFKLGTKYSAAATFTVQGPTGGRVAVLMGCYGIGTSRLMGAVVEVLADDKGLRWPVELSPYAAHVLVHGQENRQVAENYAREIEKRTGREVLVDDRDVGLGAKLSDYELMGMPHGVLVSDRTQEEGLLELLDRFAGDKQSMTPGQDVMMSRTSGVTASSCVAASAMSGSVPSLLDNL